MVYISSLLSDDAFSYRHHMTFKTTSIPEHIKQRIRRRCVIRPSVSLERESDKPPPPLAKLLHARRPYLNDQLEEPGKCKGRGPCSVTLTLKQSPGGHDFIHPSHERLALERLAFCSQGLLYQLKKPNSILPSDKVELKGRRVTSSIASRMEEDFARGLGLAIPIEPWTNEELFKFMIEAFVLWVQDDRCDPDLRNFIIKFLESPPVISLIIKINS